jgi:cellulose synthase/poly-beta-1,6-N-acetylglucosamine synthase-like glycosyltransferase
VDDALAVVATFLLVAAAALCLPGFVFFLECALGAVGRAAAPSPEGARPRFVILVPAHDEAAGIAATVEALREQLAEHDRLVVVADNCTDTTAAIARAAGAEVLERDDPERRGKGFALAFGVESLRAAPPDVVLVVDADCRLAPGSAERLAREASRKGRPVQARNTVTPPEGATPLARLAAFAFLVKNVVRPLGLGRLGLPCPLMGTGMAFPFSLLASMPLATGALAEDLLLGVDLVLRGKAPVLCLDASVTSPMPEKRRARAAQTERWEYGHLSTLFRRAPRLLWQGIRRARPELFGVALDLGIPPLSLLVVACGGVFAASCVVAIAGASTAPALLAGVATAMVASGVTLAWLTHGRRGLPFSTLLSAPLYVLKKVPIYFGFLRRRRRTWVRTERDDRAP